MLDIFNTKDSIMANKFISYSLKERNYENDEEDRTVEVSEDVLNQLHASHYFSMKKGKALFMLSTSKELGTIKKKRNHLILWKERKKKDQKLKDQKLMKKVIKNY